MDKAELVELLAMGPIRISMNDGRSFDVVDDQCLVSDMSLMTCAESLETA